MAVLIASDLGKDIAGQPLLRGVSLKLERRDRLTVAGRNGAGKTTLLRMLMGETGIDGGELVLEKGARVALHDQRPPRERGLSLRDHVTSGARDLVALEQELSRLEGAMADGATDQSTLDAYARAQARLEHGGGYTWRERAMGTVHGLGFTDDDLDRSLSTFSGGELTRASLARALAAGPDLLLLDEPTNHLDVESLEWLEKALVEMDAAIVLVAHDRWFLEAVGTAVLELEAGRTRFFAGPWHAWRREQAARELALGRSIERQEAEIARMERFVERFRAKATKARQAQSRVKAIDKLKAGQSTRDPRGHTRPEAVGRTRELGFAFKAPERSGRVVFELEGGRLEVPGRVLLDDAELWLERGEHVSLVGPNGSGKTTLLGVLTGAAEPAAGKVSTGHNVNLGYLSQHAEELDDAATVLEAAQRATGLTPNKTRALLGRFLFSGDEAEKAVADLSGGERRRLSLAVLVASGANVLVLDEPTNHLDLESREALEDALRDFQGALLLVSHDRALLDAVGTRTVAVEDGTLRSYVGGWAEYRREREARAELARAPRAAKQKSAPREQAAPARSKNAQRRTAELEREIERAEAELRAVDDQLADPSAWASPSSAERSTKRHEDAKRRVAELLEQWEGVAG